MLLQFHQLHRTCAFAANVPNQSEIVGFKNGRGSDLEESLWHIYNFHIKFAKGAKQRVSTAHISEGNESIFP